MTPKKKKNNNLKSAIEKLTTSPKRVFLLDGLGALLSALFLFIIVSFFGQKFGLPDKALYLLLTLALTFSVYSLFCYYFRDKQWKLFLRAILIANLLYIILTIMTLINNSNSVTILGFFYFTIEILIISIIVMIEFKTINKYKNNLN